MSQKTLVALGDSITYGFPYTPDQSWVEQIKKITGWRVVNSGICGDTLDDMGMRLERDVLVYRPDLVTLMGGTNDFYLGMSQLQVRRSFLSIMEALEREGIEVVLVGLPLPVDDLTEGALKLWIKWLLEYCGENRRPVIDFYRDFIDEEGRIKEELLLDGCHPRIRGYEIMGERIIRTLKDLGLIARPG